MAAVAFGTTLHDAKDMLKKVFEARNPTIKGGEVAGIEWEGMLIKDDMELNAPQHRDQIVVFIEQLVHDK